MKPKVQATPHESAHLHVSGEATYVDDIPELSGTLHCALGLSSQAHANIMDIDLRAVLEVEAVVAVYTARDIPGSNSCGPINDDDPILADGSVEYIGQPIFVVVAESHNIARQAATLATIKYAPLPAILDPQIAKQAGSFVVPPIRLQQGEARQNLAAAPHRL